YGIYQLLLVSYRGQTVGKKAMSITIRLVKNEKNGGADANVFKRGILNGLLCLIPFYILFDLLLIFRDDHRCIHDFIAGTHVVKANPLENPVAAGIRPMKSIPIKNIVLLVFSLAAFFLLAALNSEFPEFRVRLKSAAKTCISLLSPSGIAQVIQK